MIDPDETLPPPAAPPTIPAPPPGLCSSCRREWCVCDVDDDEPGRTWPAIGGGG